MQPSFYSHGKLLLSGEYAVLDGAWSLALPTRKGQWLRITPTEKKGVFWQSVDVHKNIWFEGQLFQNKTEDKITQTLEKILETAVSLNPDFQKQLAGVCVETTLEFERSWGLGSSSTLINNIAQWAEVNPFELLFKGFGGSGYDIACAKSNSPILYRLTDRKPTVYPLHFTPDFTDKLYFVYLNQKQDSKQGISQYKSVKKEKKQYLTRISELTEQMVRCQSLDEFCKLMDEHEQITSDFIRLPKVKDLYFNDFDGSIKSLGAWGGDFVLVASPNADIASYFTSKGFKNIIPFRDMVFNTD